ncbi:lytic transglycosylase domain-containing protein [Leadbettera azotonutricia]|uniref:Transglycosylase, SLT family n=1 Tax=Leadbettera azotonutricia (strain ATCC BAA-888 / DSM 13862 / ZAS-9) TaxID=545695 RepID=F5Y8F0_LEAAZ|nr:lytic transglycosylase domain-containing protein [Leadbettera azotonutricia]AEF81759.1 transglycosylase, SLT family [Leadbettera azotonutricia ZAS-9]
MAKNFKNSRILKSALLACLLCFGRTALLPAAESADAIPGGAAAISPTEALVENPALPPRPLRSQRAARPDHPLYRNALPPPYANSNSAPIRSSPNSLLTSSALERSLTQYYIRQYSTAGGLAWLNAVMERGGPYLGFIRKEIEERGLPPELLYLPVIESQFLASAVSKSGAMGLWQFMKNSIAPFDMKVNDWVDERRDFWKSTQGALRKLEENYNYFGDWPLALAAYNAGLGAINRAVKDSGLKNYWLLSDKKILKTETIHYVPKLLAVAQILSNPRRYGLSPQWAEIPQWTRVAVTRPADLNILASEAGLDAAELKKANRELIYNITPPGSGYSLKARLEDADKIRAVLARTDLPLIKYYIHTIRSGDTLLALGLHYGISVEQILQSNPGTQARYLKIGGRLMIPAFKDVEPYIAPKASAVGLVFAGNHLVKRGETLWSIALAYEVDPELLAEANSMGLNDVLREGRSLKTPIRE